MDFKQTETQVLANRYFSSSCFNETWSHLDTNEPEISDMLACAYASLYHWKKREDVTTDHLITAHWLLARAYERANLACGLRLHADKALSLASESNTKGMSLLSAYEAQARAFYLEGNKVDGRQFKVKGLDLLASLEPTISSEEYGYCKDDLDSIVECN
ncbi:hypothetical protein NRI82_004677 [Vibrio vulnificus]|nr:hypothetical protein [Vibrio vulnificus]